MRELLIKSKNKNIEYFKHPGYRSVTENCKYYSTILNNALCCFTDCAKDYLLLKFFEIPATGSLLLCEVSDVLEPIIISMGFKDMVNCIFCNKDNVFDKINFILDPINLDIINTIRMNGYIFIRQNHTTDNRGQLILDIALQNSL
jgi:hypothetical protein